ncbi:MAG TPA: DUF5655 domain-containing protein [Thermoplasmata archaeon]|nr:DUF5655 domain-containing protein [Thermoplasmata archaeon]
MPEVHDWGRMRDQIRRQLIRQTGADIPEWNERKRKARIRKEKDLHTWLTRQGVTGYPRMLLGYERFGYPDFLTATADELIDGQYKGKPAARVIYDAIIARVQSLGSVEVQARKTYVSLLGPRRTFARVQVLGRDAVALALRVQARPGGRLDPSKVHDSMPVQLTIRSALELDQEALAWVRRALKEAGGAYPLH